MGAFSCLWGPASHCQTAEAAVHSLHSATHSHPSWSSVPRKQVLDCWTQVPPTACLAELPLSGAGDKSVTRVREGEEGLESQPEMGKGRKKGQGHWFTACGGRGGLVSSPTPLALDRCSELFPCTEPGLGTACKFQ